MGVLFTSDLHLGHARVAGIRGFASVAEHDDAVATNWRHAVREDDVVYVLGDVTANASAKALEPALERLKRLPGRKRLIAGNHDGAHPMNRDAHKHLRRYLEAFESVASAARIRVEGREVLLSHFPYERDRDDVERYPQWRLRDEGLPLLHGHTHGTERLTWRPAETIHGWGGRKWDIPGRTEVHVGLDAWGLRPVPSAHVHILLEGALG